RPHDIGHAIAEAVAYIPETRLSALIFHCVVQEAGDGHVFGAAIFENRRGDREQMRDVRDGRFLANLPTVNMGGIQQGPVKSIGEGDCNTHGWTLKPYFSAIASSWARVMGV